MLIKRIITGVLGIIATIFVVNFGDWLFGGMVMLLALTAWHEFCDAFGHMKTKLAKNIGFIAIAFVVLCVWQGNADESIAVILATVLMVLAQAVLNHEKFSIQEACISICGILYISLPFAHLILLRFIDTPEFLATGIGDIASGCAFIWLAFIGTWASDTFAFFVGSKFGKTKLCPVLSPKKSREGFIGGVLGTVMSLLLVGAVLSFSMVHMVILGILIAVLGTIGDLVESSFKRLTGIKDSGQILPGHGGVLDRFDSVMFTVPLVYYYVKIFVIY